MSKSDPGGRNQGRASNYMDHKRDQGGRLLDASSELEVLKCIMLREGYLTRITRLVEDMRRKAKRSHGQVQSFPPGMVDLLDLLRTATLDTVEAISLWRLSQVTPRSATFEWNGQNYLMKLLEDCDFLDQVEALRSWIGFRVAGNPFFFPPQSSSGEEPSADSDDFSSKMVAENLEFDNVGLAGVGTQPWLGPLELEVVEGDFEARRVKGVEGKGSRSKQRKVKRPGAANRLAPYAAAVVNDLTLATTVKSPPSQRSGHPGYTTVPCGSGANMPGARQKYPAVGIEGIVPNLVCKEDAHRIGVAREVLIKEQRRVLQVRRSSEVLRDEGARGGKKLTSSGALPRQSRRCLSTASHLQSKKRTSKISSSLQETGETRSLVLTTAGLQKQPVPDPHPGLGPVILRSDYAGGELHPSPFLYTVSDAHMDEINDQRTKLSSITQGPPQENHGERCFTAPTVASCMTGSLASELRRHKAPSRSSVSNNRATTAPATLPSTSAPRLRSDSGQSLPSSDAMDQGRCVLHRESVDPQEQRELASSSYCTRGLGLSRKVGAELRALTAAGTTGRRQPPPREVRLRRLARDVARRTTELNRLMREEEFLRRRLALYRGGVQWRSDPQSENEVCKRGKGVEAMIEEVAVKKTMVVTCDDGVSRRASGILVSSRTSMSPMKRMMKMLETKRQEIQLKKFDLSVKRDELGCLRIVQKQGRERKLALELERRRAQLGEGQVLPDDQTVAESLEDSSCTLVQKRFRGNVGRAYAAWYRRNIQQAATTIQRGVRFIWDRRATRRRLLLNASAMPMQAAIRMFLERQQYKRLQQQRRALSTACKLQAVGRGMLGRRVAAARRSMIAAATKALNWVSLENLQPGHLTELAHAIYGALVDPVRQFPPAGVLGALRVTLTILDASNETIDAGMTAKGKRDMVTFRTALGRTLRTAVLPTDLTWEMGARVLDRPFRLLRRMRAFASGLGAPSDSTPTRLLRLSPNAARLLSAYRSDPSWSLDSLSVMREGATAAKAFIGWATELEKVYREQPRVQKFLMDAQPAWLRKGRSFQRRRRQLELRVESCRHGVTIAKKYRRHLRTMGRAYGDPEVALDVLEQRREEAEEAARELEHQRNDFLAVQANAEEAVGTALREHVEFAEREVSVARREEEMAVRLGQSSPEELAVIAGKIRDKGVILRELVRRLHEWERRCREEKKPLLEEWIPPTSGQVRMSRALGEARAWRQLANVEKTRLVEHAGGRRFLKGLNIKEAEVWRRACESLAACAADVESKETRLAEDVERFELDLSRANEEAAAAKVLSSPWDNETEEARVLERAEDADAARDEQRKCMGATLPPGMLGIGDQSRAGSAKSSIDLSHRPTLLLLGLDLPASTRKSIRTGLSQSAPDLFGCHITGLDALPSLASATRMAARDRWFLGPGREATAENTSPSTIPKHADRQRGGCAKEDSGISREFARSARGRGCRRDPSNGDTWEEGTDISKARTHLVQDHLSKGRSVSVEVVSGPGLWARGRFLRDLEALLGGLDGCGCECEDGNTSPSKYAGPRVVLVDGHISNRSGGGIDLTHGTKFLWNLTQDKERSGKVLNPNGSQERGPGQVLPSASLTAMRIKARLEEASEFLYELSLRYGGKPNPFKAIERHASVPSNTPQETFKQEPSFQEVVPKSGLWCNASIRQGRSKAPLAAKASPGMELLLAACQMLLHPDQRYDIGHCKVDGEQTDAPLQSLVKGHRAATISSLPFIGSRVREDFAATLKYASGLAASCRKQLAKHPSTRGMSEVLRGAAIGELPLETAVAIRRLALHPDWPGTSPCLSFTECPMSKAFTGWVMAAVAGATGVALEGGGGELNADEECPPTGGAPSNETDARDITGGRIVDCEERYKPQSLRDEYEERQRERTLLRGMHVVLIDDEISVLDDDSGWSLPARDTLRNSDGQGTKGGRHVKEARCSKASEVLYTLLEIILRPFNVFHEADCQIPLTSTEQPAESSPSTSNPPGEPFGVTPSLEHDGDRFSVTVSRAFGVIYARAVSLGGRMSRGQVTIARARDEDLIPLLAPNWMEKHDLSALRELRTEPAAWHALVMTLVISFPYEVAPSKKEVLEQRQGGEEDFRGKSTIDGNYRVGQSGVLSFQHERRLTLTTSCVLMGCAIQVSVFEESRSDFWCEAEIPSALISNGDPPYTVGMRVPKECIPLVLGDSHPMHMQTILDASDLRYLSELIADRLKLCRVGSAQKGSTSYSYWLDVMNGSGTLSENVGESIEGEASYIHAKSLRPHSAGREFKLSLRKRSTGQVVFSRLVSFWMPSVGKREREGDKIEAGMPVVMSSCELADRDAQRSSRQVIQWLVVVKEFGHRGECGELRVEAHDPRSGGTVDTFIPTPEFTRMLLGEWQAKLKATDQFNKQSIRYWRDSLTWRMRMVFEPPCHGNSTYQVKSGESASFGNVERSKLLFSKSQEDSVSCIIVDARTPLFVLRGIEISLEPSLNSDGVGSDIFDLMILPPHPEMGNSNYSQGFPTSVELVMTQRHTMATFNFFVPAKAFAEEFDPLVAACLTTPAALATELGLPVPRVVLCNLVSQWFRFAPESSRDEQCPALSLSFPRTEIIATEPYVSLRSSGLRRTTYFGSARKDQRMGSNKYGVQNNKRRNSFRHEHALDTEHGRQNCRESVGGSTNYSMCNSTTTLMLKPKNERMVFRRKLAVPRVAYADESKISPSTSLRSTDGPHSECTHTLEPKVLAISVYEGFTTGCTGRVERYLRFCARDDTVRPPIETTTTVPWEGTCEGVQGGKLWRVVAGGLSFGRTHDRAGKHVGTFLKVSTQDMVHGLVYSNSVVELERRKSAPNATTPSHEEAGAPHQVTTVTAPTREPQTEAKEECIKKYDGHPRVAGGIDEGDEQEYPALDSEQVTTTFPPRDAGVAADSSRRHTERGSSHDPQREEKQDKCVAPVNGPDSLLPGQMQRGRERGSTTRSTDGHVDHTSTIYSGWHRITGLCLHVQCLQERHHERKDEFRSPNPYDIDGQIETTSLRPLGRGGATSFPYDASLRFVVCDPITGYRTDVTVTVSDLCGNSSTTGGIVQVELLEAGRRPALAKAIAQNLRLVFEAGGGYSVVLPLPLEWNTSPRKHL